jgi:hypothetical protein
MQRAPEAWAQNDPAILTRRKVSEATTVREATIARAVESAKPVEVAEGKHKQNQTRKGTAQKMIKKMIKELMRKTK